MPLNIRRICTLLSLILLFVGVNLAQNPTTGDVLRGRISKAKALVAVKNYAAAIYELEGIKRETNDAAVTSVTQVMLMGCYLEQLDYKRAQTLLNEIFTAQKTNKPNSNYFIVAGQVVKSARNQFERYKSLGLSVSDRNLPTEAVADLEKMRETVELVVSHSKNLGENKKLTADSMALLEEASNARSGLARDDYDAKRWKNEIADAREQLSASRTKIINTVDDGTPSTIDANKTLATNSTPSFSTIPDQSSNKPLNTQNQVTKKEEVNPNPERPVKNESLQNNNVIEPKKEETRIPPQPTETKTANQVIPSRERLVNNSPKTETTAANPVKSEVPNTVAAKDNSPLEVGSLIDFATAKVAPTYPPAAKTMRMTGTVRIEVLVNEDGSIGEVKNTSGPSMLQRAATDALKKWKFKPFLRDGQPVKASGFVSFNFSL